MTAPRSYNDAERSQLLNDLSLLKSDDDDAVAQDPKWFLPLDAHARALRPETLVVRGGRGAGKSSLFHFLGHVQRDPTLATAALGSGSSFADTQWVEGFSSGIDHPALQVVGAFGPRVSDDLRRYFWYGWLCARLSSATGTALPAGLLADAVNGSRTPDAIAAGAETQLSELTTWMDGLERSRARPLIVIYDSLDRMGATATSKAMAASLLSMWLSLADRYRHIRPKVFVREDLFQASLSAFADASKLDARSVSIDWRVEDLFRVLIKHMANTSDALKDWVEGSSRGIPLTWSPLGWMPPPALPEIGRGSQKSFVDHLAGEWMGTGTKKGLTYRWIPNRLQDAHARAVPRSILGLVRNAAVFALDRGPEAQSLRLLTPLELQGALEKTSRRRVDELKEEFPVVGRLQHLKGRSVMIARKVAVQALGGGPNEPDDYGSDGEQALNALIELGVMSERADGRIDVPDIYRYGFGILRKGGVKRPR